MQPINPSKGNHSTLPGILRVAQSVFQAMNGAVQDSQPAGTDSAGVYNKFTQDNGSGVTLRIGAAGSKEPVQWVTNNVGVAINHGLQRQPIGFHLVDKDKSCDVFRTVTPPTAAIITLACTDATANCTVYIF